MRSRMRLLDINVLQAVRVTVAIESLLHCQYSGRRRQRGKISLQKVVPSKSLG